MLYLVGLGLSSRGISQYGMQIVKRCKKVYIENYTVDFPYPLSEIVEVIGKKVEPANREKVESLEIVDEAKKKDIALLIYGSPLTATTHISLLEEAKKSGVKCEIIYAASVLDAVAESGLQLYKFGKIASMPRWNKEKNFKPESFIEIVKDNQKTDAHSLILIDIGMGFQQALKQLEEVANKNKMSIKKLVVCQKLGTKKGKAIYRNVKELRDYEGIRKPYCIILPAKKLHFAEKEFLEGL